MSVRKRQRELLKTARVLDEAATIEQTSGTHLRIRLTGPLGSEMVIAAASPSDHRDAKNFKRDLNKVARRVGLLPPLERT